MFNDYLVDWDLTPDGAPIITHSSQLLPVLYKNMPAMLKVATAAEERLGNKLMVRWDGNGAAPVWAHDAKALLMARAMGSDSLVAMAQGGQDDAASQIMCKVVAKLHVHPITETTELIPLTSWFKELHIAALQHGGILQQSSIIVKELLADQQDIVVLHGDIHHQNILDFQSLGFLAIDPKGLIGERGFDYANIFCNPSFELATQTGRLTKQLKVVSDAAHLKPKRLLQWILAYAGLSAAWSLGEGNSAQLALTIADIAASELGKS